MVNYVCRTCLYVCDNEFSFRRLEKVKQVLELFVPEIKTFVGKYSLICEQCYYFLKNVEKFKTKCIETQKKLYSMNIETIKDAHDAVLQSVVNEGLFRRKKDKFSEFNVETVSQPRLKRPAAQDKPRQLNKRYKQDLSIPVTSTVTSDTEITLKNLLNTSEKPVQMQLNSEKNETTPSKSSVADDLLELFNSDSSDLAGFRGFAVTGISSNKESEETSNNNTSKENNELIMNYEEDEYMDRNDLVLAGILFDDKSADVDRPAESESEEDVEVVDIDISDSSSSSDENTQRIEFKISKGEKKKQLSKIVKGGISNHGTESASVPMSAIVKTEELKDENPGLYQDHRTTKLSMEEIDNENRGNNSRELSKSGSQFANSKKKPNNKTGRARGTWNLEQKSVMLKWFEKHILEKKYPRNKECIKLKMAQPELFEEKTVLQIRTFVYNTYRIKPI